MLIPWRLYHSPEQVYPVGLNLSCNNAIGRKGTHQLVEALTTNTSITTCDMTLPSKCEKYATQCTQYNTVKDRIKFW